MCILLISVSSWLAEEFSRLTLTARGAYEYYKNVKKKSTFSQVHQNSFGSGVGGIPVPEQVQQRFFLVDCLVLAAKKNVGENPTCARMVLVLF